MLNTPVKLALLGLLFLLCNNVMAESTEGVAQVTEQKSEDMPQVAEQKSVDVPKEPEQKIAIETPVESVQQPAVTPQVEALKESVLTLNRDLLILEEELLYPASNQVAIYLSMDIGQFFNLDAVKVEIDNKLVASELYTDKQINALFRGGVQRLFVGNLKAGEHEVSAFFTGRGPQQDYKRGAKLIVSKAQSALALELKIIDSSAQLQPTFDIKEWKSE